MNSFGISLPKSFNEKLQLIQTSLVKAGVTLVNMIHMIDSPGRLSLIDKMIDTGNDSLILLGMAYHLLCLRCHEFMKPDVDWCYGHLCSTNIQHSSLLFGDNVEEEIKKIGDNVPIKYPTLCGCCLVIMSKWEG